MKGSEREPTFIGAGNRKADSMSDDWARNVGPRTAVVLMSRPGRLGGAEGYEPVIKWDGTGSWPNSLDFESEWV